MKHPATSHYATREHKASKSWFTSCHSAPWGAGMGLTLQCEPARFWQPLGVKKERLPRSPSVLPMLNVNMMGNRL